MKFMSIHLQNYIGIYNGLGLYDIHIDFSSCIYKTITIRGDNGSGKSTLMKALSVFPDSNDAFIPGMPARKEIILADNDVLYRLVFVHGVKTNGDREVTKAYVTKTFNGGAAELNENGNVSSYKDIIFSELGLDSNFEALSQLSTDDRGLADKRPAERKRFVNSIISSLETYNGIYKTLTKKSSAYKSMISAVVGKLNVLGDEASIVSNLEQLEKQIASIQQDKDSMIETIGREQSRIALLDPDGSIQSTHKDVEKEVKSIEAEIAKIDSTIQGILRSNSITSMDIDAEYKRIVEDRNNLIIQNQIDRNKIEGLMSQKERQAEELQSRIQRLNNLKSESPYETIVEKIHEYEQILAGIEQDLSVVGISDVSSINKDEYILALESLRDLNDHIKVFKDSVDFSTMQDIVEEYLQTGIIPASINTKAISNNIEANKEYLSQLRSSHIAITSRMPILDRLNLRPEGCTDDSCEFIKEALEFSSHNPREELKRIEEEIDYYENHVLVDLNRDLVTAEALNAARNAFSILVRDVNKNARLLTKLIHGEMFADSKIFFERLMSGYSFEYMDSLYQYIDRANEFDIYKQTKKILEEYKSELKVYETKAETIDMIEREIDDINASLGTIMLQIDPTNEAIANRDKEIIRYQELEGVFEGLFSLREKRESFKEALDHNQKYLEDSERRMEDINLSIETIDGLQSDIKQLNQQLDPMIRARDKASHSAQMFQEYKKEKEELEKNYEYIETIKYYSSPTTGIQLVFMELYMGKIISLANELLSYLFSGQYVIQPFIINESEFRIPCLGSGYLNDDISSMSSAQISMISMILSFSLLYNSSTKYNIIKLDEIDGPLDYSNRLLFLDVLNRIMNIMNTEQCIMISHNSELQVDDTDVILLKHDVNNPEYRRGHIIWSY